MTLLNKDLIHRLCAPRMWGQIGMWFHGHAAFPSRDVQGATRPLGPCSVLLQHSPPRRQPRSLSPKD
jgi:hypothetical protein